MILSPDQYKDASVYDLLVAAERGYAGLDHAWLHAILDRGEGAIDGLLQYGLEERPDDRLFLDDALVDILYELRSPNALPLALSIAARSSDDLAPRLILVFQALGRTAVEPLLELYQASGKGQETDLAFLLASLGVRDPRILAALEERLEFDPVDGACCLASYGDPAALPSLEKALASSEESDRPAIRDAIVQLTAGADSTSEDSEHIWNDYPEQAGPSFGLLDPEEIRPFLASPVAAYRREALAALAPLEEGASFFDPVWDLARRDPDESVRARAWEFLAAAWHRKDIRESLLDVLQNENAPGLDRAGALAAVADHEKDSPLVRRFLDSFLANPATRAIALRAALNTGSERYSAEFARSLDDADSAVVAEAIQGVGYFELEEAAGRLVPFFENPELRETALANYAFAAPSPNNRRGMRSLLEKIDRLAHGLDFDESLLVKEALNTRLERYDAEPLFSPRGEILEVERAVSEKVGRNDPCPCGSGKKYKKCCGA